MHKPTGRFDLFDTILAWDQARQWGKGKKQGEIGFFFPFSPNAEPGPNSCFLCHHTTEALHDNTKNSCEAD